jgi:hypothetical protein
LLGVSIVAARVRRDGVRPLTKEDLMKYLLMAERGQSGG